MPIPTAFMIRWTRYIRRTVCLTANVICIDGKAHYIDTDCFREVGDFMQSRAELERKRQEELARQEWERIEAEERRRQQEEEQSRKEEEKAKQKSEPKKKRSL